MRDTAMAPAILRHPDPWEGDVVYDIKTHAMSEYPRESCGIVTKDKYVPCDNIHSEPTKAFRIDPKITGPLMTKGKLQAIIHSHPDGPNHPSKADQQGQMDMDIPWGICSVIGDEVAAVASSDIIWWGDCLPPVPLIGRRFIWGVFHCWQLYRDWFRQERGILLPTWACEDDFITNDNNMFAIHRETVGMIDLGKPDIGNLEVGDMLLGRLQGGFPNHCGVFIGDDSMLHHPPGGASGRVDVLRWWPRIETVYRYDPAHTSPLR